MQRYYLQIDDGETVTLDEEGGEFPNDELAIAGAAEMAGRLVGDLAKASTPQLVEVRIESAGHALVATVSAEVTPPPR